MAAAAADSSNGPVALVKGPPVVLAAVTGVVEAGVAASARSPVAVAIRTGGCKGRKGGAE